MSRAERGYRAELEAAHARIASLEDELRRQNEAVPSELEELVANHAKLLAGIPRRVRVATIFAWTAFALMAAPVVLIEVKYEGLVDILVGCAIMLGVPFVMVLFTPWLVRKDSEKRVATSAKRLAEAKRVHRLETENRLLAVRARSPGARIGSNSAEDEAGAPEETGGFGEQRSGRP